MRLHSLRWNPQAPLQPTACLWLWSLRACVLLGEIQWQVEGLEERVPSGKSLWGMLEATEDSGGRKRWLWILKGCVFPSLCWSERAVLGAAGSGNVQERGAPRCGIHFS